MDRRHILVLDVETTQRFPHQDSCEICQIGSLILDRTTLKELSRFQSLMRPVDFDAISDDALRVNGLSREQLAEAPEASVVFENWAQWVKRFNTAKDESFFGAPVACGYNITGFDLPIIDRYCRKYDYWNEKDNRQNLYYPLNQLDVFHLVWLFTRTNSDVKSISLKNTLLYMGMAEEEIDKGAHDAMWDVEQTAKIAIKFLRLAKFMTDVNPETGNRRLQMKDCLKNG